VEKEERLSLSRNIVISLLELGLSVEGIPLDDIGKETLAYLIADTMEAFEEGEYDLDRFYDIDQFYTDQNDYN
jgi:hypothetical protein